MTERLITPESFEDIARRLHTGQDIVDGATDEGFVFTNYRGGYVGYHEGDGGYIVARMEKGTETIGRSEPKLRTRENEYVKVELRRVEMNTPPEDLDPDTVRDHFDEGEKIDTGYIHGYRVTPLSSVVDDVFKWYGQSD